MTNMEIHGEKRDGNSWRIRDTENQTWKFMENTQYREPNIELNGKYAIQRIQHGNS